MKTDERVRSLHARMKALRRVKERRRTCAIGAGCSALAACLILTVFTAGGPHSGGIAGMYSGAMMLFDGAGEYVLIALAAFFAGAALTAFILRRLRKTAGQSGQKDNDSTNNNCDGGSL